MRACGLPSPPLPSLLHLLTCSSFPGSTRDPSARTNTCSLAPLSNAPRSIVATTALIAPRTVSENERTHAPHAPTHAPTHDANTQARMHGGPSSPSPSFDAVYSGNCVKDKQFAWDFCPLSCGMCPIAEACDKAARLRGGVTGCPRLQRSSGSWEIDAQTLLRHAQEYVGTN